MDTKYTRKEIVRAAEDLAQAFKIDPHLLFKSIPVLFELFGSELEPLSDAILKHEKEHNGDVSEVPSENIIRAGYLSVLSVMSLQLGHDLLESGVVVMDPEDRGNIVNAIIKARGGHN